MTDQNVFGPIEYLVVEFPGGTLDSEFFEQLMALVDGGTIRILDLEFIVKYAEGHAVVIDAGELSINEVDTTAFAGASSALLDKADIAVIAEDIGIGSIAAVLLYEELTLVPVIKAWTDQGARVITDGHLELDELAAVLAATATAQENQE